MRDAQPLGGDPGALLAVLVDQEVGAPVTREIEQSAGQLRADRSAEHPRPDDGRQPAPGEALAFGDERERGGQVGRPGRDVTQAEPLHDRPQARPGQHGDIMAGAPRGEGQGDQRQEVPECRVGRERDAHRVMLRALGRRRSRGRRDDPQSRSSVRRAALTRSSRPGPTAGSLTASRDASRASPSE